MVLTSTLWELASLWHRVVTCVPDLPSFTVSVIVLVMPRALECSLCLRLLLESIGLTGA